MVGKSTIIGYHPVGAATCLRKQEVGKPSQNAAQPCAKAEGCVRDDLRADKVRKGWGFRVRTFLKGKKLCFGFVDLEKLLIGSREVK